MPEPRPQPTRTDDNEFKYKRGIWIPLWALLKIPFLLLFIPLYRAVKNDVNWKAAWATVGVFEVLLLCAEHYALSRGHWVYNENRILGPKVWGIPIEEPLLYYLFSPLIIISVMAFIKGKLKKFSGGTA